MRPPISTPRGSRNPPLRTKRPTTRLPWLTALHGAEHDGPPLSPIPSSFDDNEAQSLRSDKAESQTSSPLHEPSAMYDKTNSSSQGYQRKIIIRGRSVDGNASSASVRHTDHTTSGTEQSSLVESSPQSPRTLPNRAPPSVPDDSRLVSKPAPPLARLAQDLRVTTSSVSMRPSDYSETGEISDMPAATLNETGVIVPEQGPVMRGPATYHTRQRQANQLRSEDDVMDEAVQRSIAGLETHMHEAAYLADDASRSNRPEEVSVILEEAARALEQSAGVENRQGRTAQGSLADGGGAVPWSSISPVNSDEDSTFSETSSLANEPAPVAGSVVREPVIVHPASDPPSPHQTNVGGPVSVDWAYRSALSRHDDPPHSPGDRAIRRRSTRPRVQLPPESITTRSPEDLPSNTDVRESTARDSEPLPYLRHSSLTVRQPQGSEDSLSAAEQPPRPLGRASTQAFNQVAGQNWGRDKYDEKEYISSGALKGKHHITLREDQKWSLHHHKRQPIARNWTIWRKRFTATVACINTALIGVIVGIYAGEVPAIQYAMTDLHHQVILGNVYLFLGMAISTFLFWPLPLLHGRKPYTLVALGITLPLQFPQAVMVMERRFGDNSKYMTGLLLSRGLSGLALGFAHINFRSTLLDLFGASLQSTHPHGEIVVVDDVRRHGGGMGLWLGTWSFCSIGSIALGFLIGAEIVSGLNVAWGFYITVILIACTLFLNVLAPETRRSAHRRTMAEVELPNMSISRRVARGEIKMHVSGDGPKWWWEEVFAGVYLTAKMLDQPGFGLMALYLGWVYGEIVLVIVLLGNLLSVRYQWRPAYVGLGVFSIAIGAFLAIPNTKANFLSKSRSHPYRTDSMTFQPRITWTSHMVRRAAFMIILPLAGIAYTLASAGRYVQYMVPIVFAGLIGYVSNLAISECHGLIMEAFDVSDLQPGVNSRHRLQSLAPSTLRRRTTYSSYPRVTAGFFASQTIGFLLAAAATGVGGILTRQVGAQKATGITAGILFFLTILLTMALWRYKSVQVIPNHLFGTNFGGAEADKRHSMASMQSDKSWRAVIVGNPSGKIRRMNLLELGGLSRWTEIRRLNRLLNRSTTQPLNPGWR